MLPPKSGWRSDVVVSVSLEDMTTLPPRMHDPTYAASDTKLSISCKTSLLFCVKALLTPLVLQSSIARGLLASPWRSKNLRFTTTCSNPNSDRICSRESYGPFKKPRPTSSRVTWYSCWAMSGSSLWMGDAANDLFLHTDDFTKSSGEVVALTICSGIKGDGTCSPTKSTPLFMKSTTAKILVPMLS